MISAGKWERLRHWLCSSRLLFAREPTAWMHAPSQPLMRSPLSQFQTPTAPRRNSRFFRVRLLVRLPCRADHSAYFGLARFISPFFSAVDADQAKSLLHRCQCNSRRENEISVDGSVENGPVPITWPAWPLSI